MPRATNVLRAGEARPRRATDTLILDFDQRHAKQGFFFTGKGACIEFDFAEPPALATDDALVLDDGSLIDIVADSEALIEARIPDPARWRGPPGSSATATCRCRSSPTGCACAATPTIEALLAGSRRQAHAAGCAV